MVDNPNNLKYEITYKNNSYVEGSSKHYYKSGTKTSIKKNTKFVKTINQ